MEKTAGRAQVLEDKLREMLEEHRNKRSVEKQAMPWQLRRAGQLLTGSRAKALKKRVVHDREFAETFRRINAREGRRGAKRLKPTRRSEETMRLVEKDLRGENLAVLGARIGTGAGVAGLGIGVPLALRKKKGKSDLEKLAALYQLTKEGSAPEGTVKTLLKFKPSTFAAVAGPPLLYLTYKMLKPKQRKRAVDPSSSAADASFVPLPGSGEPSAPL